MIIIDIRLCDIFAPLAASPFGICSLWNRHCLGTLLVICSFMLKAVGALALKPREPCSLEQNWSRGKTCISGSSVNAPCHPMMIFVNAVWHTDDTELNAALVMYTIPKLTWRPHHNAWNVPSLVMSRMVQCVQLGLTGRRSQCVLVQKPIPYEKYAAFAYVAFACTVVWPNWWLILKRSSRSLLIPHLKLSRNHTQGVHLMNAVLLLKLYWWQQWEANVHAYWELLVMDVYQ